MAHPDAGIPSWANLGTARQQDNSQPSVPHMAKNADEEAVHIEGATGGTPVLASGGTELADTAMLAGI